MKRSPSVPLLVLGSLAVLEGCSPGNTVELKQNRYASLEDCRKDWGDDTQCAPENGNRPGGNGSGGSGGGHFYYGPRYYWDPQTNGPVTVSPSGETRPASGFRGSSESAMSGESVHAGSISRGGFGSIGRGLSMGG